MSGKIFKRILSAVMCIALTGGIIYSTDKLAVSLSEISSEEERAYACVVSTSYMPPAKRATYPDASEQEKNIEIPNIAGAIMANVKELLPEFKIAVITAKPYVNIRKAADESSEAVGRFYPYSCAVIEEKGEVWSKVVSGELEGYVKNDFLILGDEAGKILEEKGEQNKDGFWELPGAVSMDEIYKKERAAAETLKKEGGQNGAAESGAAGDIQNGDSASSQSGAVSAQASEVYLLACIVHSESANQSYEGQLAVANVVLNRVKSPLFPNTISEVVYQRGQFTPAFSGTLASVLQSGPSELSVQAANAALAGTNNIGSYLYFNGYVDLSKVNSYVVIGDHTFYN